MSRYVTPGALIVSTPELEEFDVPEDEIPEWTRQLRIPPHPGAASRGACDTNTREDG